LTRLGNSRSEQSSLLLVRQVLCAIPQFEKATIVAKLKAARDRKRVQTSKCEGGKTYVEANPMLVKRARELNGQPRLSLRQISASLAAQGFTTPRGVPYSASAVASMLVT
jgi:hypothetical protein